MDNKLSAPSRTMHWVDRNKIKPNDYNPNKVSRQNLELLTQSIFTNGWTLPIVVRPDGTIIDGFHRWTVAGPDWKYVPPSEEDDRRTLYERLEGKVLVVIVDHKDKAKNIYGTVTHNRARGTHLLEPMKKIVKELMDEGKTVEEIGKQLGMRPEEIFRLSDFSKEDFLNLVDHLAEIIYENGRIILAGGYSPLSVTVDFQTDMISMGKQAIEYHQFDKNFKFKDTDVVFFLTATGRALSHVSKSLKEKGLCESHIVLMTQNIKYKNYDSICADDVVHVLGTFDGIEFNYQIMRLFDLIRIRYYTKYFI